MKEKITATELAKQLEMTIDTLLAHCKEANMRIKDGDHEISPAQQQKLITFLEEHAEQSKTATVKTVAPAKPVGKKTLSLKKAPVEKTEAATEDKPKKMTLSRKGVNNIDIKSSQGETKSIAVKVLKKRTFVKRPAVPVPPPEEEAKPEPKKEAVKTAEDTKEANADKKTDTPKADTTKTEKTTPAAATEKSASKPHVKFKQPIETEKKDNSEEKEREKHLKKSRLMAEEKQKNRKIDLRTIDLNEDEEEYEEVHSPSQFDKHRHQTSHRSAKQAFEKPTAPISRTVNVPQEINVTELAQRMSVKAGQVIKALMKMGTMASINQVLDQETAMLVVEEMGHKAVEVSEDAIEHTIHEGINATGELESRAPVVTIMGHVDHGKTTLLDYIRRTKVASSEAGGITQNIGAYHVETSKGMITFLDTPGHEAFTAMRARGAQVTDLVILVVAADDGVMPQTIEAIQHAKAGNVPLIVAVNKIDKPEADPEKIKTELSNHDVIPEDWGGDTMFAHISAKAGTGIDGLLDAILLQAEVLELKARSQGAAQGIVIESRLDKGRGVITSVLVQQGTLKQGDIILAGTKSGRVRAILDEQGHKIESAGPSIPVEVLGLPETPASGDDFNVVATERKAREIAMFRQNKEREAQLSKHQATKLDDLIAQMGQGEKTSLNILLKADVHGSVEAIHDSLLKLTNDEVNINFIAKGVGGITSSDATLALASKAIIIAFNVRADATAKQIIAKESLDVHYHSIIYNAIDEVKNALLGMLSPQFKEEFLGLAEVREVFRSSKLGAIAGCMVLEGAIQRNKPIRVLRDNVVIYEGELESLRRFKENMSEAKKGTECGIGVKDYNDIKAGDQIEVFDSIQVERKL